MKLRKSRLGHFSCRRKRNRDTSFAERLTGEKLGKSIGLKDSLIAGIVLEHKANIFTRNTKHVERVSGLKVEMW